MKQKEKMKMSNTKNETQNTSCGTKEINVKITKTSYERILNNIKDTWPDWKKNLCNEELIVSVKSKKL